MGAVINASSLPWVTSDCDWYVDKQMVCVSSHQCCFFFLISLEMENGGRKRVSYETASSGKPRKCQEKNFLSVNAALSLYHRRRIGGDISLRRTRVGRPLLGILIITRALF